MALQERLEIFTTRAGQKKVYFKGYLYGRQKVLCSKRVLWRCHLKHCVGICCQGCVTTDGDVTHVTSENPPHCHPTNLADESVARLRADRRNVQVSSKPSSSSPGSNASQQIATTDSAGVRYSDCSSYRGCSIVDIPLESLRPGQVVVLDQAIASSDYLDTLPLVSPSSCGVCHSQIQTADETIQCEAGCRVWFHRHCVGLSRDAFAMLAAERRARWVCDQCLATRTIPLVIRGPWPSEYAMQLHA